VLSRSGTHPRTAATRVRPTPRQASASSGSPVLYTVLGIMGTLLLGAGLVIWSAQIRPPEISPPTTTLPPPPTPEPPPTTAPQPPATTAPPPPTVSPEGKAAATVRSAQSSFSRGDYDRAVSQAQEALRIDPGNQGARSVLDNALKGQQAKQRFVAAQAALRANDYDKALSEAQAGSQLAPWDGQGPDLVQQVRTAQQRAAQEAEAAKAAAVKAEVDGLLQRAETSLQGKQYDAALALYDQALARDPGNSRAAQGRSAALTAKVLADAAVDAGNRGGGGSGRSFVLGKTVAQAQKQGEVPPGFQTTEGVQAEATQAAATPGRLEIRVKPAEVKAGEQFTVEIEMVNEGGAPIQLKDMIVTTTVNGRRSQGPIPPQVREVAPRQSAMLYQLAGNYWREDTEQWSMQVMVRTTGGASYRNEIAWQ
jgi:tetratricopeptide (TPR) repeat protein